MVNIQAIKLYINRKCHQIKYKTVKEQNWTVWPESILAPLNATVNNLVLKGLNPGTKYMVQVNTETSVGQNEGIIVRDGFNTTGKKRRRSSFRRNSSSEGTPRASNGGSSSSFWRGNRCPDCRGRVSTTQSKPPSETIAKKCQKFYEMGEEGAEY